MHDLPNRAISILQPWAWLIVAGHKDIENRDWPTAFRGSILIHAGKGYDREADAWPWPDIPRPRPEQFERDGIVGVADIIDCVRHSPSRWWQGRYGFVIRNARPLPFRPYRGALGIFPVSEIDADGQARPAAKQGGLPL